MGGERALEIARNFTNLAEWGDGVERVGFAVGRRGVRRETKRKQKIVNRK